MLASWRHWVPSPHVLWGFFTHDIVDRSLENTFCVFQPDRIGYLSAMVELLSLPPSSSASANASLDGNGVHHGRGWSVLMPYLRWRDAFHHDRNWDYACPPPLSYAVDWRNLEVDALTWAKAGCHHLVWLASFCVCFCPLKTDRP